MFQIESFHEAKLSTVTNRPETHGDERVPAMSLGLELTTANTILDAIDPTLRPSLFKTIDDEPELPGIPASMPVLRCNSIETVNLPTSHEGWVLEVDDGIDETTPMVFGACKVDKFRVEPKQGGSIVLRFRVGTSDVDAERMGNLGMRVGNAVWIKLKAPEKKPDAIDGTEGHPGAAQAEQEQQGERTGSLFEQDCGEEGGQAGASEQPADETPGENWPFPRGEADGQTGEASAEDVAAAKPTRRARKTATVLQ